MDFGSLPISGVRRVDAACDAYEDDWRGGCRPRIERVLGLNLRRFLSEVLGDLQARSASRDAGGRA